MWKRLLLLSIARPRSGHFTLRERDARFLFLGFMTNKKQPPPSAVEDQPWYPEWRAAVERVIAASMARDATMVGTPERKAADQECEAAMAAFREIANRLR